MKKHITQLIDFTKVDALLESFNKSTGFVTAILDLEGNILSKSGWRPICTDFHRIHSETFANCVISDTVLANKMIEGEKYHFYKCLNGLVDVAMPIVLNNEHVANLFSGQFFFEEPDMEVFRMQARKYGFDEDKYLGLLSQVPIVSEEKVKIAMDFLHQMTQLISERSLEKAELTVAKEKLEETSANISAIIEGTSDSVWAFDRDYNILYINHVFQRDFQASFGVFLEKGSNLLTSLPEPIRPIYQSRYDRVLNNEQFTIVDEVETAIGNLYIQITFNPILKNNEVIGGSCFGSNITERKETENLITNLSTSFAHLMGKSFFEAICEDAAKVLGLDYVFVGKLNDNEQSVTVSGGFTKGKPMGDLTYDLAGTPCENVMGKEICTYPVGIQKLFPYDELLQLMGVEGYIGVPLFSKDNKAIGIIVALHEKIIENTDKIKQVFSFYAERVSAELQRSISEEALRESESQFRGLFDFAADAIFIADIETGIIIHANEKAGLLMKCPIDELIGKHQRELHPSEKNTFNENTFQKQVHEIEELNYAIPIENTVVCSDGTQIPVEIIASEVTYRGKKCLMGIFRDISERKKYEEDLIAAKEKSEESEERFILAMKASNDGLFDWNLETNSIYYSPGWKKMLGYEDNELPNDFSFWETTTAPQDVKKSWELQHKLITKQIDRFVLEFKMKHKDGHWVDILSRAEAIFNENGKAIRIVGTHTDITERKQAEIKLKISQEKAIESEALLNITNKITNVGGWEIKLKSNELIWTKQVYEIHEVDEDFEPTVEKAINFYDENSVPVIQEAVNEAIETGKHFDVELKITTAKGNIKDVRAIGYVKFDENNQAEYVFGSFQDITERKKADNQLRKLSQAVEQSPASVVITDLNGDIEYVNPKFLEATGYRFDEVIGKNPRVLKSGEQPREYYKNLWDTITSGKIWQGEFHNKKKNGDLYWESVQISPIKNEKGETINYLAVKEDITDRKAMEIQLNETMEQVQKYAKHLQKVREEEKALLAREIHDELGQLLVALKMDTGVTTTQYNKAESNEDKEKIKLKLSKHADMITKAISSARRIMYGLRPVKLEMLGFAGACEEYLEDFSSRYEIECVTNIDLDIEKLDEERSLALYRILQETMMNIIKHAQATAVEIKYYQVGNDIVFEVKDNGVGFNVGKDGREDSYGLLGISERVSLLKGTLEIDSLPGKGTRVTVKFPLG